jgi:hypothetical protein
MKSRRLKATAVTIACRRRFRWRCSWLPDKDPRGGPSPLPRQVSFASTLTGPASLPPGGAEQFRATTYLTDGSQRDVTTEAAWTSADSSRSFRSRPAASRRGEIAAKQTFAWRCRKSSARTGESPAPWDVQALGKGARLRQQCGRDRCADSARVSRNGATPWRPSSRFLASETPPAAAVARDAPSPADRGGPQDTRRYPGHREELVLRVRRALVADEGRIDCCPAPGHDVSSIEGRVPRTHLHSGEG